VVFPGTAMIAHRFPVSTFAVMFAAGDALAPKTGMKHTKIV